MISILNLAARVVAALAVFVLVANLARYAAGGEPAAAPTAGEVIKAKARHLAAHPDCIVCGSDTDIATGSPCEVHHINPVHIHPELAATATNLVTLCRHDHWWVGHRKNWTNDVSTVLEDAARIRSAWDHKEVAR